jgi:carbon-monoxide dehydrogenase large subunit
VGARYDSGTYAANMDLALRVADWDGFPERRAVAQKRGRLLGLGFANYVESSIGSPRERAEITVLPEGCVRMVIGTQPAGQGQETSFAQVLADLLSVPMASIDIVMGDTDIVSVGGGSHSGRSMRHAATVISLASLALIERGKSIVALVLDAPQNDISFTDGRFVATGRNRSFDFFELAREAVRIALPKDLQRGLAVAADNEMHDPVFPNGAAVCEVEIDPETGALDLTRYASVDDVGRCINPLIVDGQTHGAIAQGVGEALWEQIYLDPSSGQPLTGSLMDYTLPRASELPNFRTEIVEVLSPTNPYGIKAGGEGGTTPALAVIVGAILDALAPLGVRDVPMPATTSAIWQAIQNCQTEDKLTTIIAVDVVID